MDKLRIEIDDQVLIEYNNNFHWPPENVMEYPILFIKAVVLWTPSGPGDFWHFKDENGIVFAQNPFDPNLARIIKIEGKKQNDNS